MKHNIERLATEGTVTIPHVWIDRPDWLDDATEGVVTISHVWIDRHDGLEGGDVVLRLQWWSSFLPGTMHCLGYLN